MTANLLKTKRFFPLLITQFLGALNDNMFKNALLTLVALKMSAQSGVLSNVIAGLFILPFFLLSATAGEIADKYPRDKIARILKLTELLLMSGVALVYYWQSLPCLIVLLALMGAQSAFFGPVKYSLLPQHLHPEELVAGNAYIESTTYLAILSGLVLGTLLPIWGAIALLIALAVAGCIAAWQIPFSPAPRPELQICKNVFASTGKNFVFLRKHDFLFKSVLGATWFWMIGALVAVQVYPLCSQILNAGPSVITFFLILFSVGVAIGSYCCNRLLKGAIQTTYVPLGAVGMAVSLFLLFWFTADYPTARQQVGLAEFFRMPYAFGISFNLLLLAFWGGLYIIPLNAFMQNRAPKAYVATVIAGNNIFNAFGMVLIAVFAAVFLGAGFTLPQLFLTMALFSLAVAVYICALLPDELTRSLLQSLLRFLFRSRIDGLSHFKKAGKKVLIVSNHVSLLDGVLLAAFMPERITSAINTEWTQKWFIPVIRLLVDFYPMDPSNPLSVRSLIEEIRKGRKVMIFPEGRITVTGSVMKVYEGAAVIAAKAGAKILPVRINGAQYSKFSYLKDKIKTRWLPTITLSLLEARRFEMPEGAGGHDGRFLVAKKLYGLMSETMFETVETEKNIYAALQDAAAVHGQKRKVLYSVPGEGVSLAKLNRQSRKLAASLYPLLKEHSRVGIVSMEGAACFQIFFALQILGKTAVMLNPEQVAAQIATAGVTVVIAGQEAKERQIDTKIVYYEQLSAKRSWKNCLWQRCRLQPAKEEALVLFDGNMPLAFSHKSLLAAIAQLSIVMPLNKSDVLLNAWQPWQPAFWVLSGLYPLLSGASVVCYAHAEHSRVVAEICYDRQVTMLSGTGSMFAAWGKTAHPYDFFSVQNAVCCENLPLEAEIFNLWVAKFGIRILNSWLPDGAATLVSLNSAIYNRIGSLGCRLPGVKYENGKFYGANFARGEFTPVPKCLQEDDFGFVTFCEEK